ncbi:type I methionyl aminopeptidase [Wolinella succinogenes]|uniref:Methionine aminopeptidase n=1 Tax=Wolinella succinogenes (strain ATCC 29543 / DSM 1740 / CCUG 13145 / JCM 31913 / LMG 7466 / NCTC 11488 / FDC 602W) TaxID=273121 RepID=Q7M8F2_WOLSU|nr:type I methionyl aminopeptidase [Wolinella succinogenes]CAE10724.1 METHIONINE AMINOPEPTIDASE MAP PEPTIDASE M [Wolinella succinogenes]VEG80872.1 Methionine aminopeptidase 1 [Wolinella succinogenes]HCZ18601.1 type I methionyl aminopeptidase [Helicobacter sp.]
MAIAIRKPEEIKALASANRIVAQTLSLLREHAKPGISLLELDKIAEDFIRSQGARPSFKGLYGFPGAICTSVNEVIIHGIPNGYQLKEGDILGVDIGTEYKGWFGDGAATFGIGAVTQNDEALMACSRDALLYAIDSIRVDMRFKELSHLIEQFILKRGMVPLRGFCGHGIGRKPHEEPEIPNYLEGGNPKQGPKIREGMVFCIEPMICQKSGEAKILSDKWAVVSHDGLNGSHHEHTVAIVNGRAEILSKE